MAIPASINEHLMRFRDWTSLHHNLLWAYEAPVLAQARIGSYTHQDTSCWLIRKGEVTVTTGGNAVTAKAGEWVFVASPTRHQHFSDNAEILSIHFHLSWPGGEQIINRPHNIIIQAADHPLLERSARAIVRHLKRSFPDADAFLPEQRCTLENFLQVQNLVPLWLNAYLRVLSEIGIFPKHLQERDSRVLLGVIELDKHPLSEKFSEKLALQKANLNRSQFDSLFVKSYGITPRRYFEQRRLIEAKNLLAHTNMSIKEIALDLGFRHSSHFSLWFRRLATVSAIAFRSSKH